MTENDVQLLGYRASPFVNRVQFALNLKSIEYEFLPEINWPVKSELLVKSNPVRQKIPVLINGGKPVNESRVIVEYIDEAWPENGPSILPADPSGRAAARFWGAYVDDHLQVFPMLGDLKVAKDEESKAAVVGKFVEKLTLLEDAFVFPMLGDLKVAKDEESKAAVVGKFVEKLTLLEDAFVKLSNGKSYFGGDDLGYVDLAFGCYLGWLKLGETVANVKFFDETKTPSLAKWVDRFVSHSSVQGTLPEIHELLVAVKAREAWRAAQGK